MHILDTDTLTHLHAGHPSVMRRLETLSDPDVGTTIITKIELLQGRFEYVLKASDGSSLLKAQQRLLRTEELLAQIRIVPFDERSMAEFERLRVQRRFRKIGRADLLSDVIFQKGIRMSLGLRVHFFDEQNAIKRIPYTKFNRLFIEDANERFPACAGKKVRCAMTIVELERRKPVRIVHSDFIIIHFAPDGSLDFEEYGRSLSLVGNMIDIGSLGRQDNVISIVPHISRKRYKEQFTWKPTNKEIDLLVRDILP